MVGVINANDNVSLATQKQYAAESPYMLAPGESFPSEAGIPKGDVNRGPNLPPTQTASNSSSPSSSPPSSPVPTNPSSGKISSGVIAGIVVAAVVVVCLLGALFFLLGRHKAMLQFMRRSPDAAHGHDPHHGPHYEIRPGPGGHMPLYHSIAPSTAIYGSPMMQQYQDPHFAPAPPYAGHPTPSPSPAPVAMAELPSPAEKNVGEGYAVEMAEKHSQENQARYADSPYTTERAATPEIEPHGSNSQPDRVASPPDPAVSPSPSPMPSPRPMSWWGRSRSTKTA